MLKTWFNQYKWYAVLTLFLIYSVGMWNVSTTYNDSSWNKKELQRTEKFIEIQTQNYKLKDEISKMLQAELTRQRTEGSKITEELIREILKDPVYKSCRVTDGVRSALKRKLDNQSP